MEVRQQGPAWTQEVAAPLGQQKQNRVLSSQEAVCWLFAARARLGSAWLAQ